MSLPAIRLPAVAMVPVAAIPVLGSGKADYPAVLALVESSLPRGEQSVP